MPLQAYQANPEQTRKGIGQNVPISAWIPSFLSPHFHKVDIMNYYIEKKSKIKRIIQPSDANLSVLVPNSP